MTLKDSFNSMDSIVDEFMPSTMLGATLNMACMTIGAGVLALPVAFANAGIAVAAVTIAIIGVWTVYSIQYMTECVERLDLNSYEDISRELLGPTAESISRWMLIVICMGAAVGYIVLIGDMTVPFEADILYYAPSVPEMYVREFGMILIFLFTMFPLSLIKDIGRLASASSLAVAAAGYLGLFITYRYYFPLEGGKLGHLRGHGKHRVAVHEDACADPKVSYAHFDFLLLLAMPIMMYSFDCQTLVFQLYHSLPEPNVKKMTKVGLGAVVIASLSYAFIGLFGYLSFGDCVKGNILLNYNPKVDKLAAIAYVFFAVPVIVAFVLTLIPCRDAIMAMLYNVKPNSPKSAQPKAMSFYTIAGGVSLSCLFLAIFVPGILTVIALLGAIVSSTLCFTYPGLYAWRLHALGIIRAEGFRLFMVISMIGIGIFGATLGTAVAVYQTYLGHE